jgi:hypothetical protein
MCMKQKRKAKKLGGCVFEKSLRLHNKFAGEHF